MALPALLRKLAGDNDIEVSDEELERLGLDSEEPGTPEPEAEDNNNDIFGQELPGQASARLEIFCSDELATNQTAEGTDGLMWEPIIREGQWAVRPAAEWQAPRPAEGRRRHSTNQRKEIGLRISSTPSTKRPIENVTVPTSHNNSHWRTQGFIKLKIVDGEYKPKGKDKTVKVKVLMGGYDITQA
jgi:hypothetical protein